MIAADGEDAAPLFVAVVPQAAVSTRTRATINKRCIGYLQLGLISDGRQFRG